MIANYFAFIFVFNGAKSSKYKREGYCFFDVELDFLGDKTMPSFTFPRKASRFENVLATLKAALVEKYGSEDKIPVHRLRDLAVIARCVPNEDLRAENNGACPVRQQGSVVIGALLFIQGNINKGYAMLSSTRSSLYTAIHKLKLLSPDGRVSIFDDEVAQKFALNAFYQAYQQKYLNDVGKPTTAKPFKLDGFNHDEFKSDIEKMLGNYPAISDEMWDAFCSGRAAVPRGYKAEEPAPASTWSLGSLLPNFLWSSPQQPAEAEEPVVSATSSQTSPTS